MSSTTPTKALASGGCWIPDNFRPLKISVALLFHARTFSQGVYPIQQHSHDPNREADSPLRGNAVQRHPAVAQERIGPRCRREPTHPIVNLRAGANRAQSGLFYCD